MPAVFLNSIALARTHPCLTERGKIVVVGRPSSSLAEVLPYLATLPGVIAYNPELPALTFRRQLDLLTLYALLPQTNCKQCGEATCMAFAFALLQQRRALFVVDRIFSRGILQRNLN